jgi:acetoin utilization deacetylase AcuC-like enzyme
MGFAPQRVIDFVNTRFVLVENLADPNKKMSIKPISLQQVKQLHEKDYIELTINAQNELDDIENEKDYECIRN